MTAVRAVVPSDALPDAVTVQAPGKINLSLIVGRVDHRGYHELATVFQAVGLYETVTVSADRDLSLVTASSVPGAVPDDATNLALRAARLLQEHTGCERGAAIAIDKAVPIAGGMGGGSADAAATLVALNRLWGLDLPPEELRDLGGRLGADVPFAMLGHTAVGLGNGNDVTSVLTDGSWTWVLARPGGHLSTPEVYARFDLLAEELELDVPERPEPDPLLLQALRAGDARLLGQALRNDLQAAAFSMQSSLELVVECAERAGACGALVSGSGPSIAALAEDAAHAQEIRAALDASGLVEATWIVEGSVPGARIVAETPAAA